jgi:predicted negative regulator of RcsB-dependent stress response
LKINYLTVICYSLVHFPHDPYALNAYGLLLERQKLYNSSAKQFSEGLKYVTDPKLKDLLNINLARVMVQLQRFEESVKICLSIKDANFASHCQLALSLFKGKKIIKTKINKKDF